MIDAVQPVVVFVVRVPLSETFRLDHSFMFCHSLCSAGL